MKNSFLKHFLIIGSGTLINMILGLITTPLITRIVDPIEYGQLSIFTMYSDIAVMILCMGLDQALVRYYYERKDMDYKRALLFRCIKLPVLISILVSIVIIILSACSVVKFEFNSLIMIMLCIYTAVQLIYRFSLLIVRLEYKSKVYSSLTILRKATYVFIILPLVLLIKKEYLLLLVIANIVAAGICMVGSIIVQKRIWNYFENDDQRCHISYTELLRYAYPYIISMGITTIFQAIDKISLNIYCTYSEVGIYSSTMSLVHIFAIVQTTFNTLWAPMAVEHYTNDKNDRGFYQNGNQIITVVMFFIGISLILIKDIFAVLLGSKYREAAYILPFLIFNPIMYTISETTVTGLVFMKKSKMQVVVAAGACVTNIIGNIILVPPLGCQGAAISTGIAYIVFFTLRTMLSNKYFYVDFKLPKFYLITGVVSIYALYNMFIPFNIGAVAGYIICLSVLIILYLDTVKWGILYLKNTVMDLCSKKH